MRGRHAAIFAAFALVAGCVPTADIECPEATDQILGACLVRCSADDECLVGEVCEAETGAGVCVAGLSERPVILTLTAADQTVTRGRPAQLSYATASAVRVSIDHDALADTSEGSGNIWTKPLFDTTTFTLTAYGNGGRSHRTITIQVVDRQEAPTIVDFSASRTSLKAGELTTLVWQVAGADRIKVLSGNTLIHSTIEASGSIAHFPTRPVSLTLVAENAAGESRKELALDVLVTPVTIGRFEATPNAAFIGGQIRFMWSTTGAESIEILYQGTDLVFESSESAVVKMGEHGWVMPQVEGNTVSFTLVAIGTGGQMAEKQIDVVINHGGN
jgi:hypothetical protein